MTRARPDLSRFDARPGDSEELLTLKYLGEQYTLYGTIDDVNMKHVFDALAKADAANRALAVANYRTAAE